MAIRTITMSLDAATLALRVGASAARDLRRIERGETTPEALLAEYLDGCEDESDRELWAEYVSAVVSAIG